MFEWTELFWIYTHVDYVQLVRIDTVILNDVVITI